MDATQLKQQLSENDLLAILTDLGAEPYLEKSKIICRTICHGGHKHKNEYYIDSQMFHCYTDSCGTFDLFSLVEKVKGIEFSEAFKYVKDYFGYTSNEFNEYNYNDVADLSFFNKFNKTVLYEDIATIDEKLLNVYDDSYHISWVRDGIHPSTMRKFNIKLSISNQQIIIPHYNKDGGLVGIRGRNLNPDIVSQGKKYMPVIRTGIMYNHPTGANLYGLYENLENIKKMKKLIIFESEKSVMQLDTIYHGSGIGVCVSGSSFSDKQLDLISNLEIEEVIIGFDKEYEKIGDSLERYYAQKIQETVANKLLPYFSVSVLWDLENDLETKDAPTDKGASVFKKLFSSRISLI